MKKIISVVLSLMLTACASNGYKEFYTPLVNTNDIAEIEILKDGETPELYETDNIERDVQILESKRYLLIGYSSFNGGYQSTDYAIAQAKQVGATVVLVTSEYTDTQTVNTTLFLPDTQTSYTNGSVYSTNARGTYSATTTTHGTKAVPVSSTQHRYDQEAAYFVKSNFKYKFGFHYKDLTPEQRSNIGRNTGVLVGTVIEGTPVFYANLLAGDILVGVDGNMVRNQKHVDKLLQAVPTSQEKSTLTVLRNGKEIDLVVDFSMNDD
ncbi:PDZ domain-containing protein [Vibrio sp. 10N.286.49.E11]|uniref:PDZ domain-containing protein n=1 Tax=Vibrio sp. 10N.286.49.E11 TaxID=3229703 RepID=UPI00355268E9